MDGGGSAAGSAALGCSSAQFEGWNRVERSLPYRSEGFKDRGFGRPLSGRPAVFWRASSMGLPSDPCDFLPKDFR